MTDQTSTPEQMRALAVEAESETCRVRYTAKEAKSLALEQAAALHAAADQLEAVQRVADSHRSDAETAACIVSVRLDAILTAGTAPQASPTV